MLHVAFLPCKRATLQTLIGVKLISTVERKKHIYFALFRSLVAISPATTHTLHLLPFSLSPVTKSSIDLIHVILDILIPPVFLVALLCILLPYLVFRSLLFISRCILSENVARKVIIITGASSGIGEHLAYEYSKRGACLALVARRENRLKEVASRARLFGSPDVIDIVADVSSVQDCKRFVDIAVNHFGRLDHLVNNAGIVPMCLFEDITDITKLAPAMDINFWGQVYGIHFAIPHLRQSKGKIIGITSSSGWLPAPRMCFYNASKAALISLYECLRSELGSDVGITIITPGLIESEMTQGKFLSKEGQIILDQEKRDVEMTLVPVRTVTAAAKTIVNCACRGDLYLTEPAWVSTTFYLKTLCHEIVEWSNRLTLIPASSRSETGTGRNTNTISKKLLDLSGLKNYFYPESVRRPHLKPS